MYNTEETQQEKSYKKIFQRSPGSKENRQAVQQHIIRWNSVLTVVSWAQCSSMERNNKTISNRFILLGLWPESSHLVILIYLILLVYCMAVMSNVVLILLIWLDLHLQSPMYFLLSHLSSLTWPLISTSVPKMVTNFFSGERVISQVGCGTQIFSQLNPGIAECLC